MIPLVPDIDKTLLIGVFIGMLAGGVLSLMMSEILKINRNRRSRSSEPTLAPAPQDRIEEALASSGPRFEVLVYDWWAPEDEPLEGDLPRWRWEVRDADWRLKASLVDSAPLLGDRAHPFAVGNEVEGETAMRRALEWVTANGEDCGPYRIVVAP